MLAILYWIILVIGALFGGYFSWSTASNTPWGVGNVVWVFVLLVLIGLKLFPVAL
jgi:hypothetical protein